MRKIRKWIIFLAILTSSFVLSACNNTSSAKTKADDLNVSQVPNNQSTNATDKINTTNKVNSNDKVNSHDKINEHEIRIKLTFDDKEAIAVLENNPTTQSLIIQLPITVSFDDFAGAEKIAYTPTELSQKESPSGYNPDIGDITCYGPWGNLAIYYKDQPYANGLIPMGYFESGLEELSNMEKGVRVTIEKM
ncbi:cyclophilin-like fold protein [Clostridioides difficile]|nr:cyclophilin-like fold protein [Clostridioides difficile]